MKDTVDVASIRDRFIRIRYQTIHILMSIISLPYHYEHLQQYCFEDYLERSHDVQTITTKTFVQHRRKLFLLLLTALNKETDTSNAQLLFGR
jgi:hypothetical protein